MSFPTLTYPVTILFAFNLVRLGFALPMVETRRKPSRFQTHLAITEYPIVGCHGGGLNSLLTACHRHAGGPISTNYQV